jgi:amphiphysin
MLSNQAAMAHYLSIIYDTSLGTEVPEGAVQKRFQQTPAANLQAVNDAEAAMAYCRDEVLPELDVVDRDIVRPLLELSEIIKVINKTMIKRDHKLIDFDRHRIALQKLNGKAERSFSEEKQIFKVKTIKYKKMVALDSHRHSPQ